MKKYLLYGGLAVGAYLLYKSFAKPKTATAVSGAIAVDASGTNVINTIDSANTLVAGLTSALSGN